MFRSRAVAKLIFFFRKVPFSSTSAQHVLSYQLIYVPCARYANIEEKLQTSVYLQMYVHYTVYSVHRTHIFIFMHMLWGGAIYSMYIFSFQQTKTYNLSSLPQIYILEFVFSAHFSFRNHRAGAMAEWLGH